MGIPLLAKATPRRGSFFVEFGELLGIIEGYVSRLNYNEMLLIESDSLLAVNSLKNTFIDISNLGTLASDFLSRRHRNATFFFSC